MLRNIVIVALALAFVPAAASAQGFNEGDWEFTLSGSGASDKDFDTSSFAIEGSAGYFFNDNVEVGVRQGFAFADISGGSDWSGSTRLFADYHFDMETWQPYVGGNIGFLYGDSVDEQFIAGPEAGVKYFVNDTTFIYGAVEYQFLFEDADEADEAFDDGRFVYAVGIGFRK